MLASEPKKVTRRARAIGSQQNSGIFVEPGLQRLDLRRDVCDRLRRRKRFRMQFEPLDAKQFFADGRGTISGKCGRACEKGFMIVFPAIAS